MSPSAVIQRLTYLSLLLTLLVTPAGAWPQTSANLNTVSTTTLLVSVSYNGGFADSHSSGPTISPDGRFVAFESYATNLVQGGANLKSIYFRDLQIGKTELVSVSTSGGQTGGNHPALSADGRFVAFDSSALNLTPNDTNNCSDVFLRDRQSGQTERISVSSSNNQANASSELPVISADGRFVAFRSIASNLVAGDTNYNYDIFVRDRQAGTTELVSMASNGTQANSSAVNPSISADGRFVVFESQASNLVPVDTNGVEDIFVHDRQTHTTERLSLSTQGVQGNHHSQFPSISADGRFVVFQSFANNLAPNDTNTYGSDIFLRDRQTGTTEMISHSLSGTSGNDGSSQASISDDGRWVAFSSVATNLVANDTNGRADIFLLDRQSGQIERASISTGGAQANGASSRPRLAANGSAVVFDSAARNLVAGDTNGVTNIFLHQVRGASTSGIIHVQNAAGQPESSAQVYIDGQLAGQTGADGNLTVTNLSAGQRLVARKLIQEIPSAKGNHNQGSNQNWAYRVYITSLAIPAQGEPEPLTVQDPTQPQMLTLQASQPLIGFNLVASIEWDANAAYMEAIRQGLQNASAYLYDASNGQMLFEQVTVYDNNQFMRDADYRVKASNQIGPVGEINGIHTSNLSITLGRYWDSKSSNQGSWSALNGYSTLVHEFGHYGLRLYNSWQNLDGYANGNCTSPNIRKNNTPDINATIMDWQFNASEFAMRIPSVSSLWSESCTNTRQWKFNQESDWETILDVYKDEFSPVRWQLQSPTAASGTIVGPHIIPIRAWSSVNIGNNSQTGVCEPPIALRAINILGEPIANADVILHTSNRSIEQGKTDNQGLITVLGASNNDWVVATIRGIILRTSSTYVTCPQGKAYLGPNEETLVLQPTAFDLQASVLPSLLPDQAIVRVQASVPLETAPIVMLTQAGSDSAITISMSYNPSQLTYTGTITLDPGLPLSGIVLVEAVDVQTHEVDITTNFQMGSVQQNQDQTLRSADGQAELNMPAGSLSADGRVTIYPAQVNAPIPDFLRALGSHYTIQPDSGVNLLNNAYLLLYYLDLGGSFSHVNLATTQIHYWDGQIWIPITSAIDLDHGVVSGKIAFFGTYVALAEREEKIYLPVLTR